MTSPTGSIDTPRPEICYLGAGTGAGVAAGASWGVPAALVVLSLIPVIAGSLRVLEIAGGPHILPANPRIDAVPAPVVVHIIAVAAGTQVFTQGLGEGLFGTSDLSTAAWVSSGWAINAAVAEWVIRRPATRRTRRARGYTAKVGSR